MKYSKCISVDGVSIVPSEKWTHVVTLHRADGDIEENDERSPTGRLSPSADVSAKLHPPPGDRMSPVRRVFPSHVSDK